MKRFVAVVFVVLCVGGLLGAQELAPGSWDSHFKGGDTSLSVGAGFGAYIGWLSIAVYPGFEQTITDLKIADTVPVSIGAAVKGMVNLYVGGIDGLAIGVGGFVPFHFGLKNLGLDFLDNLDFYVAPGIGISFDTGDLGWTNPVEFGFAEYSGVNYFLSEGTAVFVEQVYWDYYAGATVGVVLKF